MNVGIYVAGGISTSLLFSVFESWYVGRHLEQLKLDPSLVSETFGTATFANGLIAICAGICANALAEAPAHLGPVAPFLLAVPCLAGCFAVVASTWEENYGDQETHLLQSYGEGLSLILRDRRVFLLGLVQSVVESCMYTFVFLWTPVLAEGKDRNVVLAK